MVKKLAASKGISPSSAESMLRIKIDEIRNLDQFIDYAFAAEAALEQLLKDKNATQ